MSKRVSEFSLPAAKKALATPPATPQKSRVRDFSNILTPSSAHNSPARVKLSFASSLSPPSTPTKSKSRLTPSTAAPSNTYPCTSFKQTSIYSKAKALFQRSSAQDDIISGSALVGREEEAEFLNDFLSENIESHKSKSLYISGPPGTGKTAQVNLSFKFAASKYDRVKIIKINCMSVFNPENIFHEIYCQLDTSKLSDEYGKKKTSKDMLDYLQSNSNQTVLLLLDEMDYLITKDQQILFQIFNLVSLKLKTKIIIVSISNALDLTDKFLPRLKSNNLSPESLQFFPYTAEQIKEVCTFKLRSLLSSTVCKEEDKENANGMEPEIAPTGFIPILHPAALQLCCRKSASITGDLRKAFDICYKGIEMLEAELRKKQLLSDCNNNDEMVVYSALNAPKVLISHIAKVCTLSFGENLQTRLENLNLLQKALLCSLLNLQLKKVTATNNKPSTVSVNQFFDHYTVSSADVCDGFLGSLRKGEFLEIVGTLESSSLVNIQSHPNSHNSNQNSSIIQNTGNFEISNKLIHTNVLYADILKTILDVRILEKILNYF